MTFEAHNFFFALSDYDSLNSGLVEILMLKLSYFPITLLNKRLYSLNEIT
jgi:hypothetical protein